MSRRMRLGPDNQLIEEDDAGGGPSIPVSVSNGGTGATTFTEGYVRASGTSPLTTWNASQVLDDLATNGSPVAWQFSHTFDYGITVLGDLFNDGNTILRAAFGAHLTLRTTSLYDATLTVSETFGQTKLAIVADLVTTSGTMTVSQFLNANGGMLVSGGSATFNGGATTFNHRIVEAAVLSPASLAANQNNYSPANIANARTIRQAISANVQLTGINGNPNTGGRMLRIVNLGAANTITLVHESGSSTAANRFSLPGNANLVIPINGTTDLWYDGTSQRWRYAG